MTCSQEEKVGLKLLPYLLAVLEITGPHTCQESSLTLSDTSAQFLLLLILLGIFRENVKMKEFLKKRERDRNEREKNGRVFVWFNFYDGSF